jgi:hypothetical protein
VRRTGPRRDRRTVLLGFAALAVVTTAPYVQAWRSPPPGTGFTGAFFYRDDFYQYASFAEQARHGAFLFRNKFDTRPHDPFVVNLEWWAAGVVGRLLGGPVAGWHALRLVALLGLVAGMARLLAQTGLVGLRHRWALALVLTGGGLGWLRLWTGNPGWQVPDIAMGFYPFHQSLTNAHFVVGTALLVWSVIFLLEARAGRSAGWRWVITASVLGLCRPYDFVTFTLVAGGLCALELARAETRAAGARRALDLLWLAPVFSYYALMTGAHPSFGGWGGQDIDLSPPLHAYVFAVMPAALLWAVFAARRRGEDPAAPPVRRALLVWAAGLAALHVIAPSALARQTVTGLGAAALLLAALEIPVRWLPWSTLALLPTSAFLVWRVFHPWPDCFAAREYFEATQALGTGCARGDVAVAPTDLSLMIAGLTPCSVVFGHRTLTPEYERRLAEGNRFYYDPATTAAWRLAYLEERAARFVVVPAASGARLFGLDAPYAPRLQTPLLEVWERNAEGRRR